MNQIDLRSAYVVQYTEYTKQEIIKQQTKERMSDYTNSFKM